MSTLPTVMSPNGLVPQSPTALRARLIALVSAGNPGYTADLPGSLIEDISSTDVGAMLLIDQARVELVNCLTPHGANAFLLNKLGLIYGVARGGATNTSVEVVFSGQPGFLIAEGFTISDGAHQFAVVTGGVVRSDGTTSPMFCRCTLPGEFPVPSNTVTQLVTSVPDNVELAVTNPGSGVPGTEEETLEGYRSRVLMAGRAISMGMASYLRTLLTNVEGVQARLISIVQQTLANGGGWRIIVGGGDPYEVAYAIYTALFDTSSLAGSVLNVEDITAANPGVVTTDLNHGYIDGQVIRIDGAIGMTEVNDVPKTVTVVDEKRFSIGDTSTFTPYVSGGVCTPNVRNETVSIRDFPNSYPITFVRPPQQAVAVALTWNTISENFVSPVAISQLGTAALVDYVNSVAAGQPINVFDMQKVFQDAVSDILASQLLTRLVFSVSINGVGVAPVAGTGIINGDPESFFLTSSAAVTITQG